MGHLRAVRSVPTSLVEFVTWLNSLLERGPAVGMKSVDAAMTVVKRNADRLRA